jgi:hypothetical protein
MAMTLSGNGAPRESEPRLVGFAELRGRSALRVLLRLQALGALLAPASMVAL